MELNSNQLKACGIVNGPALVIAGAGTGKTHTLTERLVYLIREKNIAPENILTLTFTNKAAQEMKERAEQKLGKGRLKGLTLGTFHQLGLKILRQELSIPDFTIFTRMDQEKLIREIVKSLGTRAPYNIPKLVEKISALKERHILFGERQPDLPAFIIYEVYQKKLKELNAMDFDDLILLPISIFKEHPHILKKYQKTFLYILVDEYQDIDQAQYELLKLLTSSHQNLWAIGDSDQAIYSFRGGNLENFLDFRRDYPDAQLITLKENYRSTEVIVKAGQSLIKRNTRRIEKEISPRIKGGQKISVWIVPDEENEARAIVREIEMHIGGTSHYEIYKGHSYLYDNSSYVQSFSDVAVLFRLHSQGRVLAKIFQESGIPYQLVGKDTKNQGPENALLQDVDFFDEKADAVTLMTLHAAKGLEFQVVFIIGLEEGLLPYTPGEITLEDYEEERRLFYVGITRAKSKLYLLMAKSRLIFGKRNTHNPSPFLDELPEGLLEKKYLYFKTKKARDTQLSLWQD